MENASKALIIAGAILLSILLISLGIMIFGQAQDTVNNSGMSDAEIQAFNNKFIKYEGEKVKGSVAKTLVSEVIASNADDTKTDITVKKGATTIVSATASSTKEISTTKQYKIEITAYTKGFVSEITLTEL